MTVALVSTTPGAEGLFNRLGRMGQALNVLNTSRDTLTSGSWAQEVEDIVDYFGDSPTALLEKVTPLITARSSAQAGLAGMAAALRGAASAVLIKMFDDDAPLPSATLTEALNALVKQMKTATTHYVDANTIGATVTQTSLTGDGTVIVSTKAGNGTNLEHLLAETLKIRVVGTTTSGAETLQILGQPAVDKLSQLWPKGSGANKQITSLDASAAGNLLTNGDMEEFTAGEPDDWEIVTGASALESSIVFKGTRAVKHTSDGSTLFQMRQELTGLEAEAPYAFNGWLRLNTAAAAGVLTVDLFDGSSVINDEAGTANSFTVDLTAVGTSFVKFQGVFRLPEPVPDTVYLRIRLSTALTNTRILYIDHCALQKMQPITANADTCWVAAFSGSVDWSLDDGAADELNTFKIVTTNDRASQWQTLFERFFLLSEKGIVLPVSGTTLVNDSLIA